MASSSHSRVWMDNRLDSLTNSVTEEFTVGINVFISFACQQPSFMATGRLLCPCARCKNEKLHSVRVVTRHLFTVGFEGNYYIWSNHGESFMESGETSNATYMGGVDFRGGYHPSHIQADPEEMFHDASETAGDILSRQYQPPLETDDVQTFDDKSYETFIEANQPLYKGCSEENTRLFLASCFLRWKTYYNIAKSAIDDIVGTMKRILPGSNSAPDSYYETKKITKALGLPLHKIDVCENNCMLFWRGEDAMLEQCRFCDSERYHPWNGKGKKIPRQRMFYLPITDRLKRLYQCDSTARHMRWHAEHAVDEGEMNHPSDGEAWKHFKNIYPRFAGEPRNIYLGLSTDGFNPLGMSGKAHSIWPVIVTPYNLPLEHIEQLKLYTEMEIPSQAIHIMIANPRLSSKERKTDLTDAKPIVLMSVLSSLHAGYFRISLSLCSQALLWKIMVHLHSELPSMAYYLMWYLALATQVSLCLLYVFKCVFLFDLVKEEFVHYIGVNYLYAPSISFLLLLQSAPMIKPQSLLYQILFWVFVVPVLTLDTKLYGQWFTTEKRFLSIMANPASQVSVIANLVAARGAAEMNWNECALFLFSLGMVHYLVIFVTLYQRLPSGNNFPSTLRPVFSLFFAAPATASLAWKAISGTFDTIAKMLFFLSLFIFMSLVCRPKLIKKSIKRFNVAWWAYSFPITFLAIDSVQYAQEVKEKVPSGLMFIFSSISVLIFLGMMLLTVANCKRLLRRDPVLWSATGPKYK